MFVGRKEHWIDKMQVYGLHTEGYSECTEAELAVARNIKASPRPLKEVLKELEVFLKSEGLE